ncbi:cell division protein FtsK, partial [Escherichia coli]|nr:cell division protein FtsK [Escherichia coli]
NISQGQDSIADGNPLDDMMAEDGDDEPVEVDFTAKANLLYKLPTIDLFALDRPKDQSKEKNLVRKNIKVLEDTFRSFGIDV